MKIIPNPYFIFNTCFNDECSFFLNGTVNCHNCRYWSHSESHIFHEVHIQHLQKLNVWTDIVCDRIVGSLLLEDDLSRELYLLKDTIEPIITNIIENNQNYLEDHLIFQQVRTMFWLFPLKYLLGKAEFIHLN